MRIQHNIAALNSYRQLGTNNNAVSKNLEKLSSGYRINRAGDDAAGLAISEKMRAQITGLETAQKNALDGISLVQTAEGALTEVHSMLNRMTELATQSANGTYSSEVDRENLQKEVATLKDEIDRISKSTNFNGIKLLDGSIGDATGISTGNVPGAPPQNMDLGSGVISATLVNEGKIVLGDPGREAEASFYISDKLQATSVGTGAKHTTSIEFEVGGSKIKFEMTSDTGAADEVSSIDISSVINHIMSQTASNTTAVTGNINTIGGTGNGTFSISFTTAGTGTKDGSVATWKDISEKYSINYADNKITIKANEKGDKATSGYEIGSTFTVTTSNTKDKTAMTDNILIDTNPSTGGAQTDIKLGDSTGLYIQGEEGKGDKYELASAKFEFNNPNLASYNNKMIEIDGVKYILRDLQNQEDWTDISELPAGTEVIEYDSNKTGTEARSLVASVADKLQTRYDGVSGTAGPSYDITITGTNSIEIKESVRWGNHILDQKDLDLSTDFSGDKFINSAPGIEINPGSASNSITLGNDLKNGTWIEIDGQRYEFAKNPANVGDNSIFVQFTEGNAASNAEALKEAIKANHPNATVSAANPTIIELGERADFEIGYKGLSLQVGDTSESYQKVTVNVKKMDTESLGISDVDISEVEGAEVAIGQLRNAINQVSATRGDLGAVQNRLEHTINNLGVTTENITAAESRIRDTDMAEEMMAYTKNNILVQAAQAMLAQANTVPQGVLQLLG